MRFEIAALIFLSAVVSGNPAVSDRILPKLAGAYSVMATLTIPYAEIEEPLTAYFDGKTGKSRIDYYGGIDKTIQRSDVGKYGTVFKISPVTNEKVQNEMTCFAVEGTPDFKIVPQAILPDLTGFKYIDDDYKEGHKCQKWQKIVTQFERVNKYTFWVIAGPSFAIPIHYEMKGYNSLLGSHYDHYYIKYENFAPGSPDAKVFDEYTQMRCHGFPGPGVDHLYIANPMMEFIGNDDSHVHKSFRSFKEKHGKTYANETEESARKDIFRQNLRFIRSHNRKGLSFTTAVNHLADMTELERKTLRGKLYTPGYNGGLPFEYSEPELRDAPASLDWRLYGAVSQVKDQSVCGSCWSFGTVGTLEGTRFLKEGNMVRLSQQALVDCSWGFGNNGCDGGEDFRAYQWMMKHGGIPSEDDYGPYMGIDGYCHAKGLPKTFSIRNFVNVTSGDADAMKVALAARGPISIAIDASPKSFSFYSSGVYYDPECKNTPEGLDHAVLAVGYGIMKGEKYWLVKNSWSTYWGNDGYILINQKNNNCGVTTSGTFVNPK